MPQDKIDALNSKLNLNDKISNYALNVLTETLYYILEIAEEISLDIFSIDEAIKIANDTDYGLAAGIFTKNIDQATRASNQLEAGQIYVNSWFTGSIATPFGGYKHSGIGREAGTEGLIEFLEVKTVGGWN